LIIDKPPGLTSLDVVSRLRRILRTKKIGHTGTLDPFATGVLVMLVGKATRLARFLDQDQKSYQALVQFGFETDTGDRDGTQKEEKSDVPPIDDLIGKINDVLVEFTGDISQIPPMYSAKKVKGKKLYELAREGIEIEREPVSLHIDELSVSSPPADIEPRSDVAVLDVTCGAGTYIRTLAEDIGKRIGVPCHLAELRRSRAGQFEISQAVTLEELEDLVENEKVESVLVSMSDSIDHLASQTLDDEMLGKVFHGMQIETHAECEAGQNVKLMNEANDLVAIGEATSDKMIQPRIVFNNE